MVGEILIVSGSVPIPKAEICVYKDQQQKRGIVSTNNVDVIVARLVERYGARREVER